MYITIYTRNDYVQRHAIRWAMENQGFDFETINADRVPEVTGTLHAQGFRQLPIVIADGLGWSGLCLDVVNRLHPVPHTASA